VPLWSAARRLASTPCIPLPLVLLAQADLEERQEQGATKARRGQRDEQYLACQSAHEQTARHAGDDQGGGQPERQGARARRHGRKVGVLPR